MHKYSAILFGIVFILIGALGFMPGVTQDGLLFGIFHVNAPHNIVHLISGLAAVAAGVSSAHAARVFFQIFGVVYGGIAILGLTRPDEPVLGFLAHNLADAWLHAFIAAVALVLGFVVRADSSDRPVVM